MIKVEELSISQIWYIDGTPADVLEHSSPLIYYLECLMVDISVILLILDPWKIVRV